MSSSPDLQEFGDDISKRLNLEDEDTVASCEGSPAKDTGQITGAFIGKDLSLPHLFW